jgi:Outer membrane protein beta-barrel domain
MLKLVLAFPITVNKNNMRRILISCTLTFLVVLQAISQEAVPVQKGSGSDISCTQRLRLARATFEAGRLHELVGTILGNEAKGCFSGVGENSFSTQEKVDALKLVTQAYIYLEEPLKADESMKQLLETDHFYVPNPIADPAEYLALYSTFRTTPVFSFGAKAGGSMTLTTITEQYYVSSEAIGQGKYSPGVSFIGGLFAEKEFFPKSKLKVLKNTVLMAEALFHLRPFKIKSPVLLSNDYDDDGTSASFEGKSITNWIDLNLILRYRLNPNNTYDPYIGVGPGASFLLSSKIDLAKAPRYNRNGDITATVTGAAIDTKGAYNKIAESITALGGIKFRFGEIYINAEARYQFGLSNLINKKNKTNEELSLNYGTTLNYYRQNNAIINIGVTYPYFKPKKLKRKK